MGMQLVKARQFANGSYWLVAWLDDSKLVDGRPDPAWLLDAQWPARNTAVFGTEAAYRQSIRSEFYALARLERNRRTSEQGNALPIEGEIIPET